MMKRILYLVTAACMLILSGSCQENLTTDKVDYELNGTWYGSDLNKEHNHILVFEKGRLTHYISKEKQSKSDFAEGVLWNHSEDDYTLVEESLYFMRGNAIHTLPGNELKWITEYVESDEYDSNGIMHLHLLSSANDGRNDLNLVKVMETTSDYYTTLSYESDKSFFVIGQEDCASVSVDFDRLLPKYNSWNNLLDAGMIGWECDPDIQLRSGEYDILDNKATFYFDVYTSDKTECTRYARLYFPGAEVLEVPFVFEKWNSILMKEQETLDYNAKTLTQQIKVSSGSSADHNFNATSNADWLTIKISGNTLSYSVSENNTGATREAVITITSDVSKTHNAYLTVTQTGELPEISLNENLLFVEAPNRYDNSGKPYYYSEMGDLIHLDIKYPRPGAIAYISESDVIQDGFMVSSHALKGEIDTIYDNYIYFYVYTPGKSYDFTIDYWKDGQILTSKKFTVKANPW